jgi:hypothetical protein
LIAVDFGLTVGLDRAATSRDLALASILLGNLPSLGPSPEALTVAEVIMREQDLMNRAAKRAKEYAGFGSFLRRSELPQAAESND